MPANDAPPRSYLPWVITSVAALVLGLSCAQDKPREGTPAPAPAVTPVRANGDTGGAGGEPGAAGATNSGDVGGAGGGSGPSHAIADWVDAKLYRFKVDELRTCGPTEGAPKPSAQPQPNDGPSLLGVAVRIQSNINEFPVSPRDVTLEAGGAIIQGAFPRKPPPAGCGPALEVKLLKAGKSARGVVVFEVPPAFASEGTTVKVAYRPTRWGGAPRSEVVVPSCLAACASEPAAKRRPEPKRRD